jgi:hypothetical protein
MKSDKQVGIVCYSLFNHLQRLADLHVPEVDYKTALQHSGNHFQLHTVAFFNNLRLAALENNLTNLLIYCYYECEDFDQFQRLTPFLCSQSHLLCSKTLHPFHQVDDVKVLDFFIYFVTNFSKNNNLPQFIQFKVIPYMHNFKIQDEKVAFLLPQYQRSNQSLH